MTHTHSTKDGIKRYRYYVCVNAQKRGWKNCPSKSLPAPEIERFVVDQIRKISKDPKLITMALAETHRQIEDSLNALASEQKLIDREIPQIHEEMRSLAGPGNGTARLAELNDRLRIAEQQQTEIRDECIRLEEELITEEVVADSLSQFDPLWDSLSTVEKARILKLLIERVEYDGKASTVSVTYRPTGFKTFAAELERMGVNV